MRRLADLSGVSNPYLSQIERGLRRPSADILSQIAMALQISAETLYERAGLLDPEGTPRGGVRDAIATDPKLTPEQRQALLNVYESFVDGQRRGTRRASLGFPPLCNAWPSSHSTRRRCCNPGPGTAAA